jgi:transcriptional regulator with XRE-family HTH domain
MTQQEIATMLNVSRSQVAMVETGRRDYPEECDKGIARMSWKAALRIADERTGGYFSNLFDYEPNIDLHPAALKERLEQEIEELITALEELRLNKRLDPLEKQRRAEKLLMEMMDVEDVINVMKGAYSQEFDIDIRVLNEKRESLIKRGDR